MAATDELIRTTCPRDCYDACGVARRAPGRGDPRRPRRPGAPRRRGRLCRKCALGYNGAWLDASARLTTPLIRDGPKGAGAFQPVDLGRGARARRRTADGASSTASGRRRSSTRTTRARSRCSATRFPHALLQPPRRDRGRPGHDLQHRRPRRARLRVRLVGDGFDPRTAATPPASSSGAPTPPRPRRTPTSTGWPRRRARSSSSTRSRPGPPQRADLHLQPFPGSDAALAFALLHVLVRDGMADRAFLADHATGLDELEPVLAACTPEWGERTTGVPAADDRARGAPLRSRPVAAVARAGAAASADGRQRDARLRAAPRRHREPGQARRRVPLPQRRDAARHRRRLRHRRRTWPRRRGRSISQMDLAERLEDPDARAGAVCLEHQHRRVQPAAGAPAPRARARGPVHRRDRHLPDGHDRFRRRRAAGRELPGVRRPRAARYFDLTRLRPGQGGASRPATRCPTRRSSGASPRRWATRSPSCSSPTTRSSRSSCARPASAWTSAGLREAGPCRTAASRSSSSPGGVFPTPSGRSRSRARGPRRTAMPRLPLPLADPRPADDLLRLLSPGVAVAAERQLRQRRQDRAGGSARRTSRCTRSTPPSAGSPTGDAVVALQRDRPRSSCELELSEGLPRGVALSPKGRWPKREAASANVNVLNPGTKSDMGEARRCTASRCG